MTDPTSPGSSGTSLWTTPASPAPQPLVEARIDRTVSAAKLKEAVTAARDRAAAFSGQVTEELLRQSV